MNFFLETAIALIVLGTFLALGNALVTITKMHLIKFHAQLLLGAAFYSFGLSVFGLFFSIKAYTCIILIPAISHFGLKLVKGKISFPQFKAPSMLLIFLAINLFLAYYPSTYFDPLNYHLFGIVNWLKLDKLVHIPSAIQLMHNSYADYTFFPLGILTGHTSLDKLVNFQVSAQLVSYGLGIVCFSFILCTFLERKFSKLWLSFFCITLILRASLHHKGLIAKNDWIALSWFALGFYFIFCSKLHENKIKLLGAFFVGMSIGAKFTYLVAALIGLFSYFLTVEKNYKTHIKILFTCVLVASPYFVRNFIWTSNPIFPMGSKVFNTELLGPSWLEGLNFFDMKLNKLTWDLVSNKLNRIFTYEPITYLFLLVPIFYKSFKNSIMLIWIGVTGFLFLFFFVVGANSEIRHFGPIALSINGFGASVLFLLCEKFKLKVSSQLLVVSSFIVVMIFNVLILDNQLNPIPSSLREGIVSPRTSSLISEKRGLYLAAKLPGFISKDSKLALLDDTPPYYFSHLGILRLWDDPNIDRDMNICGEQLRCIVNSLKKWRITHLIDTDTMFDPYYRPLVQLSLRIAMQKYPGIILTQDNGEKLISIEKLNEIISKYEL